MPALNVCRQVANIAEASGVPYLEKLAKVAVAVFELLEVRTLSPSYDFFLLPWAACRKGEKTRKMQRSSLRALRTQSSLSIPSSACIESVLVDISRTSAVQWQSESRFDCCMASTANDDAADTSVIYPKI